MRANSVRNYAAKISDVYKSLINNSRKKNSHTNFHFFQEGFMRKNCPQISVRIYCEFWLGFDARKFSKDSCAKISDVHKSSINNFRKKFFHKKISTFSKEGFKLKNCPQISVRIYLEFWLGLDAREFSKELCHKNFRCL